MIISHLNGIANILPGNRTLARVTVTTEYLPIHIFRFSIVARLSSFGNIAQSK